jgi:hypothetical protein
MNAKIRNALAVITGFIGGSIVNITLINMSGMIIPPPEGADVTTKASLHLFEIKYC